MNMMKSLVRKWRDEASSSTIYVQAALDACADELESALASSAEPGGVPEGWAAEITSIIEDFDARDQLEISGLSIREIDRRIDWRGRLQDLLATPPAHSPDAGNMVSANSPEAGVTDEMVERLAKHLCREEWKDRCPTTEQMAAQLIHARRYHDEARAMLTAALAPQPKDAER